jgi:hypothetical protein
LAIAVTSCGNNYTISIQSTASSINYQETATISATCTSGATPTLSASGGGEGQN